MTTFVQTLSHPIRHRRISPLRYWQLYRQRAHLAALDAGALRDIGLTVTEARREAQRPVWDAPAHWKR